MLPPEALVMPSELVAVDVLLDDPRFFEPFRRWFDPTFGRPSIPMETYLRLMFLKYRYRLLSDPARRAGPAPVDVDEDHDALRLDDGR
jgi:hypothetical protein